MPFLKSSQNSAISSQQSAVSTQHQEPRTRHSSLPTQHSLLITCHSPLPTLWLFDTVNIITFPSALLKVMKVYNFFPTASTGKSN
ncbi:MAG: hypothetical protein WCQ70_06320 [Lentimicrobiaceae bacterium]